jgi:hypothetical protein
MPPHGGCPNLPVPVPVPVPVPMPDLNLDLDLDLNLCPKSGEATKAASRS